MARLRTAGSVFAEDEARLLSAAADGDDLEELVRRRVAGEPLEYVLGWADFAGLRVAVDPGVFIPRRRTAYLVELATAATPPGGLVVDLCCGTGALGLAVARRVDVELFAVDIEPAAAACARRNLAGVGTALVGDLTEPLPERLRGRVDVIVANVPYVPDAAITEMPVDSREHEPRITVAGGADGLDVLRRVAREAASWLVPGGRVFSEVSAGQAGAASTALAETGLAPQVHRSQRYNATVVAAAAARTADR